MNKTLRTVAIASLAVAAAGAVAMLVVRDQMTRHQQDLFSPHAFRRLAALGHLGREEPTARNITLLRDFMAWEPRRLLRERARVIYDRMEHEAAGLMPRSGGGTA